MNVRYSKYEVNIILNSLTRSSSDSSNAYFKPHWHIAKNAQPSRRNLVPCADTKWRYKLLLSHCLVQQIITFNMEDVNPFVCLRLKICQIIFSFWVWSTKLFNRDEWVERVYDFSSWYFQNNFRPTINTNALLGRSEFPRYICCRYFTRTNIVEERKFLLKVFIALWNENINIRKYNFEWIYKTENMR